MHNKQQQGGTRENTENKEIEETKKNKGDKQRKLRVSKEIRVIGVKNMHQQAIHFSPSQQPTL